MKIACVGYRDWAISIYEQLEKELQYEFLIFRSKNEFNKTQLISFKPDMILFYGWSWIIESDLIENYKCIMLHPSPLPKYRGGSPIQNQIINNEQKSAVTLFIMDSGIDTGPIIAQKEYSLKGNLNQILNRIKKIGFLLTKMIINDGLNPIPQDDSLSTYYNRRKPEESEISVEEIINESSEYLYNKIRMLQDPYPNAYIRTKDGKKLFITEARVS